MLERIVHTGNIVFVEYVIGVEQEKTVEILRAVIAFYTRKQVLERKTHSVFGGVIVFVYRGAAGAGDLGGLVGTVVRYDEHLQHILRIIVLTHAFYKAGHHRLFVAGGYDNGEFMRHAFFRGAGLPEQADGNIEKLIGIAHEEDPREHSVYCLQDQQELGHESHIHPDFLTFRLKRRDDRVRLGRSARGRRIFPAAYLI